MLFPLLFVALRSTPVTGRQANPSQAGSDFCRSETMWGHGPMSSLDQRGRRRRPSSPYSSTGRAGVVQSSPFFKKRCPSKARCLRHK
ncbi:MAG TPA: hypothetical protein VKS79_05500 [Gemmataceae bacterium]|nr:hypothetical protein [Gemmataceae bacterium]